ncbi:hypothetical protein GGI42DRAFT_365790 [Trichoderma sp. SZMC 28013]
MTQHWAIFSLETSPAATLPQSIAHHVWLHNNLRLSGLNGNLPCTYHLNGLAGRNELPISGSQPGPDRARSVHDTSRTHYRPDDMFHMAVGEPGWECQQVCFAPSHPIGIPRSPLGDFKVVATFANADEDSTGGFDTHAARTKAIELSTTLFPYLVPPSSWLGTRAFTIRYDNGSQKSGCLAQFLADVVPPSYAPMISCLRHSKFLSFANDGMRVPPECWTAHVHGRSVSFWSQESWETVLQMLGMRRGDSCSDGHQLHVNFVPGTAAAMVSSDGATQPGIQVRTSSTPRPPHPETPAEVWMRFMSRSHADASAPAARLGRLCRGWPSPDEFTE